MYGKIRSLTDFELNPTKNYAFVTLFHNFVFDPYENDMANNR